MHYLIISFSHKNSDISTREKLAFNTIESSSSFLRLLVDFESINEGIILSTCNRVEIILSVSNVTTASEYLFIKLKEHSNIELEELKGRADIYEDNGAIHHLFCVCSSLDSLVVGETQISGQLKSAFRDAYEGGFCSQKLSRAMHFAFKCAAEIRNKTDISKSPISVASVAVSKSKEILGDLGGESALVIGAGEMSILCAKHLSSSGCNVILINRDIDRAKEAVKDSGMDDKLIRVESISKLGELINNYKLLFSATGAPHTIVTQDLIEDRNYKRFWFDLAVPRDIDNLNTQNIAIFRVDDLQEIVSKNLNLREEQAKEAYSIIGKYTIEFYRWLQTLSIEPIIKDLRKSAKEASIQELEKAIGKGHIDKESKDACMKLLHNAFNRFLHTPTLKLKEIQNDPSGDMVVESVKILFNIDKEVKMINKYKCEEFMQKEAE